MVTYREDSVLTLNVYCFNAEHDYTFGTSLCRFEITSECV